MKQLTRLRDLTWQWRTQRKRVGVIGLLGAGKTVLITSLINHLKQHNKDRFPLKRKGREMTIVELRRKKPLLAKAFNYDKHRSRLVDHRWPEKTVELAEYRALFRRKGSGGRLDLSLLDIPGERLGDIAIAEHKDYEGWSEAMLDRFESYPEFEEQAKPFQDLLNEAEGAGEIDENRLLRAYRETLARLTISCIPAVSPSAFALPLDGKLPPHEILEADSAKQIEFLVEKRFSGIDRDAEFSPLSSSLRSSQHAILKSFRERYSRYRHDVALPFARALTSCDELLVLSDVAMLLEGGPGMLNANHKLVEDLLRYAKPGFGWGKRVLDWPVFILLGGVFAIPGIRRLAFVASKADRVHDDDHDHLGWLMQEMVEASVAGHKEERALEVECLVCSAVRSTECEKIQADGCRIIRFDLNGQTRQQDVPKVPESWPPNWNGNGYTFPETRPRFPASRVKPPDHINLHRVAEFILT